jgi:Uma2 family endonuclease
MAASAHVFLTPEQYLEIERQATTRSEYYNGHMYAMSGGSFRHVRIISNLTSRLDDALIDRPCDVLSSDMRTIAGDIYAYPDIVVVCGEPQFADGRTDTLANPSVLIEVLSPSTERYDRGFKSAQFRRAPTVQEYAMVSQIEPRVEVFRRGPDGVWVLTEFAGMDAVCRFESLNCAVPLADIYRRVQFDAEELARALNPPPEVRD